MAVVLASILTFLVSGMRPRYWWKEAQAQRTARRSALVLVALLLALGALIFVSRGALGPVSPG